jgi:hypothetical protein
VRANLDALESGDRRIELVHRGSECAGIREADGKWSPRQRCPTGVAGALARPNRCAQRADRSWVAQLYPGEAQSVERGSLGLGVSGRSRQLERPRSLCGTLGRILLDQVVCG